MQSTNETNSDPPGIDNTETSSLQLSHIHCETTDDKSDSESTLIISGLKIDKEYETPTDSIYYHNEIISSNPQQPENSKDTTNYKTNYFSTNSNMNNIHQSTTTKLSQPKQKIRPIPLL